MAMRPNASGAVERFPLVASDEEIASGFASVLRRLALARSVPEILDVVVHPVRTLLRAQGVTFVLRDEAFCYYAEEDAITPLWKGRRFPLEACVSGWCMTRSASVAISDITQDPRVPQEAYRETFVKSLAMVPAPQDRPIAAIGAYWDRHGAPSERALDLLQSIANAAAMAIANVEHQRERERIEGHGRELGHQLKNLFTVVEVLARQSGGATVEDYRKALLARIGALREAREEIAASDLEGARLGMLVTRIVGPMAEDGARLDLAGPEIKLPDRVATDLAFVLGELGTNAVKYGALSTPSGRVRVEWEAADGVVELVWSERGGPAAEAPERNGFGSRFMEASVRQAMDGELERRFGPEGLTCRISFPYLR